MKTPKLTEQGYLKLWDPDQSDGEEGYPSSSHVVTDVHKLINRAHPALHAKRGIAVHYLCERRGSCCQEVMQGKVPENSLQTYRALLDAAERISYSSPSSNKSAETSQADYSSNYITTGEYAHAIATFGGSECY